MDCPGMSEDSHVSIYHIHMYLYIIFVVSLASSPSKGGGASSGIQLHPLTDGEGLWLLPRQG